MSTTRNYHNALPSDVMLEEYKIIHVLGSGGFGIAYLALDTQLDIHVVIKEYLPSELAVRDQETQHILPKNQESTQDYEWGLKQYLNEARTIAKFDHPNIVKIKKYIEANSTAYIVMNYVQGISLDELALGETATQEEIDELLPPILEGLAAVHDLGYLHRDIKPANILIQEGTHRPILIDFGSSRYLLGKHSQSVSSFITIGYSPYEQYHAQGDQGAWTDIYALGAVLYRLISGKKPVESITRLAEVSSDKPDPLVPITQMAKGDYAPSLLIAIDHALALQADERPQTVREWQMELNGNKNDVDNKKNAQRYYQVFGGVMVSLLVAASSIGLYNAMSEPEPVPVENKQDKQPPIVHKVQQPFMVGSISGAFIKQIAINDPPIKTMLINKPPAVEVVGSKPIEITESKTIEVKKKTKAKEVKKTTKKKTKGKKVKKQTKRKRTKADRAARIGVTVEDANSILKASARANKGRKITRPQRPPSPRNLAIDEKEENCSENEESCHY